jgi:hypothetical protein
MTAAVKFRQAYIAGIAIDEELTDGEDNAIVFLDPQQGCSAACSSLVRHCPD